MIDRLNRIVHSKGFNNAVLALIVLASALAGVETLRGFDETQGYGRVVALTERFILWCFMVEAAMRIAARGKGFWRWFQDPWNLLDLGVIALWLMPLVGEFAPILRLSRIFRTLRLISQVPRLQVLVGALWRSVPSLGYIGLLLGLHVYIYAVIGTNLFGLNDPLHFGSLNASLLSLFQVLTMEGWNEILSIQLYGSDVVYDDQMKALVVGMRSTEAFPRLAPAYFVSFILLGTMIIMNLFVGVLISGMEEAHDEVLEQVRARHKAAGALTVGDELQLVTRQLHEVAQRLRAIEARVGEVEIEGPGRSEAEGDDPDAA